MVYLVSQLCCLAGQRQIRHRTHCPDDLTKGEEQDHAEGLHLIFDDDPTVYHLRTLCGSMALPLGPKLTADLRHKKVEAK